MIQLFVSLVALLWAALGSFRPNVEIDIVTAPQQSSIIADSTTWFVAGLCDLGRTDKPIQINSINDFIAKCGARVTYSILYDALDTFFREGGSQAYVGRVVGPGATRGLRNLPDAGAATSLIVNALGPGAASTGISVAVVAGTQGGTYQLQVVYGGAVVEQSPDLFTQNDAVTWAAANSNYITVAVGGSALNPAPAAALALSAGTDDRASITDTQWLNALNLFTTDYGPGQVSAPGRTTDTGHTQLLDQAAAKMRTAILDAPDTSNAASLTASATNANATANGQYGGMFAPWIIVPGIIAGTTRTVPPSAFVAGRIGASDPTFGPGTPAAGGNGEAVFASNVDQPAWDQTTRNTLNNAGVNVIRSIAGTVTIYGWRSLANPNVALNWVPLGSVRYLQNLASRAWQVGQVFVFDLIDGQGHTISAYGASLTALLNDDWNLGEIYGPSPGDAFSVDVGPQVNTPASLALNQLVANLAVRPSPMAELVKIQIVNVPITQPV